MAALPLMTQFSTILRTVLLNKDVWCEILIRTPLRAYVSVQSRRESRIAGFSIVCRILCALTFVVPIDLSNAADWPQFLGPSRDGVYTGDDLADEWPSSGPVQLWERPIGEGYSNPIVVNGRLILFHREGNQDIVEAFEAETGKVIWSFGYTTDYRDRFGFSNGPRASPVVADGRLYTFGAQGILHCLEFSSGRKIWSRDMHREFGVEKGFFGASGTPLIDDARVFLNLGGSDGAGLVALDKNTGALLWKTGSDEASYASPVSARIDGEAVVVFLTSDGLVITRPHNGQILIKYPWRARSRNSVNAATPLVVGDMIFLSASYGTGATVVRFTKVQLETIWQSDTVLTNHYATSVHNDGVLYGFHGRQEYSPSFRAVDLEKGKVLWNEERFGGGSVISSGGYLLILREDGELIMAKATPESFEVVARAQILSGSVRAYPAIANGLYYARNQEMLVCFDLKNEIINKRQP